MFTFLEFSIFLQIMRFSSNCAIGCDLRSTERNRTIAKYQMACKPITSHLSTNPSKYTIPLHYPHIPHTHNKVAGYKSGNGTRGRGHRDACVGTWDARRGTWGYQVWDAGTCRMGTRGRQKLGHRGRGMWIIIAKVGGKCDITISHFPCEYVLVKATHPALLRVPPCLFTKRRLGEDPLQWRKWNRCPRLLADGILEPKAG